MHDPTAKLADGREAVSEAVKDRLVLLAEKTPDARIHEIFPINPSLMSVSVVGNGQAFREAVPEVLAGEVEPVGKVLEYLDQSLLNEPVIEFKLRRGVRWHDGKPVTSADAAFTYRAIVDPKYRSPRAGSY